MLSKNILNANLYYTIRDDLWNNVPDAKKAMQEAASNLPSPPLTQTTLGHAIGLFVEKPLYAVMKAEKGGLGDRYSHMWRNGWFPSPAVLAGPSWDITLELAQGKNKQGRAYQQKIYTAVGADAIAFRNAPPKPLGPAFPGKDRPQVALERLYRMRQIAINFPSALPILHAAQVGFTGSHNANDFYHYAMPVRNALKSGGLTTTFHAMTDMGFDCIKPDMHVARTLAYFQQLIVKKPKPSCNVNVDAFNAPLGYLGNDWNKCHVVSQAVALARTLAPSRLLPIFNGNACREVDIVLMQASLHNIILKH